MKQTARVRTPCCILLILALGSALRVAAARADDLCGTHPLGLELMLARHLRAQSSGEVKSAPSVSRSGHLAVIEDDGSLISAPNPFDLAGRSFQLLRRPRGMSAVRSKLGVKALVGTRLDLADGGSVEVPFPAGFAFPLGEAVHHSVYVNADGNLTFGAGDPDSTPSLAVFSLGPPRIAPFYADLDPGSAGAGGGVFVAFLPSRVRITWLDVPASGTGGRNTFQVSLFTTGRVNFAYGDVAAQDAVVGVTPLGGAREELALVDFDAELPVAPRRAALAEQFRRQPEVDYLGVSRAFYGHFRDAYSHLVLWFDFPQALPGGTFAAQANVKNATRGIGLDVFDAAQAFGSAGRLESVVLMGHLDRYPADPEAPIGPPLSTLDLLGHEVGHRWLARVRFRGAGGEARFDLLDHTLSHWSPAVDTDASLMEGVDLADHGDGTFTAVEATARYGPLDLYLMGLAGPAEVPDFFFVEGPGPGPDDDPEVGLTFTGSRVDVGVADVIAAEGERLPRAGEAPRAFRMAFVLLARHGEPPSPQSLAKLDRIRRRWSPFFAAATGGRAGVGTALLAR